MAEFDLPTGPAGIFAVVRKPLGGQLGGEHRMRLGGGTALAARWGHRHSTDVDLFADRADCARLFRNRQRLRSELELHTRGAANVIVNPWHAYIILGDGGEATVSSSAPLSPHPVSLDTVRGSRVALETTAEILAKKLGYRMIQNAELVPRDLYDLSVARYRDPEALHVALSVLSAEHLKDISNELRRLPDGWMQQSRQPLVGADSQPDAERAVFFVRMEIERYLRSRSPGHDQGLTRGR